MEGFAAERKNEMKMIEWEGLDQGGEGLPGYRVTQKRCLPYL